MGYNIQAGDQVQADDLEQVYRASGPYAASSGGTDAYAITVTPAPDTLEAGMVFRFKADVANTGAATLNVNSKGAKTIKKNINTDLSTGDILANQIVTVIYDGTNFQLLSKPSSIGNKLAVVTSDISVNNTEKDLVSVNLPGGTLQTNNGLYARFYVDDLSTDNNNRNFTLRLKYGSTTLATATLTINLNGWVRKNPAFIEAFLFASGATNSQEGSISIMGNYSNSGSSPTPIGSSATGTSSEDSTADKTFAITIQSDNASATGTVSHGFVEILS